jgi:hypothetical protein
LLQALLLLLIMAAPFPPVLLLHGNANPPGPLSTSQRRVLRRMRRDIANEMTHRRSSATLRTTILNKSLGARRRGRVGWRLRERVRDYYLELMALIGLTNTRAWLRDMQKLIR